MATSSFFRTITLNPSALKTINEQKAIAIPQLADDELEKGKKALTRFSPKR